MCNILFLITKLIDILMKVKARMVMSSFAFDMEIVLHKARST